MFFLQLIINMYLIDLLLFTDLAIIIAFNKILLYVIQLKQYDNA